MTLTYVFITTLVALITVGLYGWWYYYFRLPALLAYYAKKGKWLISAKENAFIFVERSDGFIFTVSKLEGTRPVLWARDENLIPSWSKDSHFWGSWFLDRGLVWLGFDAPALVKSGSIKIPAARLVPKEKRGKNLLSWISVEEKTIFHLQREFPLYVVVDGVELSDTYHAQFLVLAYAELPEIGTGKGFEAAYQFWYVLGGKAFDALRTEIERAVRTLAQELSVSRLRDGASEKVMEEILNTPKKGDALGFDGKERKGSLPDTLLQTGVTITSITVEEWKDDASEEWLTLMRYLRLL